MRKLLALFLVATMAVGVAGALDTDTPEYGPGKGFARSQEFHLEGGRVIRITRDYGPGASMDFILNDPLMGDCRLSLPLAEAKALAETMLHLIHKGADKP